MGIRFCSCSQAYCKDHVQCFDDLPNSAGAHSTRTCTQFQAHKIVSTMKLYPKKKLKRRHSMNAKTITIVPRKRKNSEPIPDILPALISDFSSSGSSEYKQRSPADSALSLKSARTKRGDLRTYTLYREGVVTRKSNQNQDPGGNANNELEDVPSTRSVHSITSVMMLEMDIEGESAILTERLKLNHILSRVPPRYLWMRWKAVYSLLADGCSMQTLFDKVSNVEQSVMIIQDQWDNVLCFKFL